MSFKFPVGIVDMTNEQFIGRENYFKILDDVLNNNNFNSISINGINKIGKTSLVKQAISRNKDKIDYCLVFKDISNDSSYEQFWFNAMSDLASFLKSNKYKDILLLSKINQDDFNNCHLFFSKEINFKKIDDNILKNKSEKLLRILPLIKSKFLIVIDEFDKAAKLFSDIHFSRFRTYIQEPSTYGLTFIFISRKHLSVIERNSFNGSTLSVVVQHYPLKGFSNEEMKIFFRILKENKINLSDNLVDDFNYFCGNHPRMLIIFGNSLLEKKNVNSLTEIYPDLSTDIRKFYEGIIKFTKDEYVYERVVKDKKTSVFSKLVQLYLGPKIDLTDSDISDLWNLGFIYDLNKITSSGEKYQTISKDFLNYLRNEARTMQGELWPNLMAFQSKLRTIIIQSFGGEVKYAHGLIENSKKNNNLIRESAIDEYVKRKKYLNDKENCFICILNFTELFKIINNENNWIKIYKGKFKQRLSKDDFSKLHFVRNDLAHDSKVLDNSQIEKIDQIIRRIESLINQK
jgi:hypothetical protein